MEGMAPAESDELLAHLYAQAGPAAGSAAISTLPPRYISSGIICTKQTLKQERDVEVGLLYRSRRQAENPEYQCFFKYARGSLAFWDNRRCIPRAGSAHDHFNRRP